MAFPMNSSSLSFGGLGRSRIGPNVTGGQQQSYHGTQLRQFSVPPNYTFAYRAGQAPDGSGGR